MKPAFHSVPMPMRRQVNALRSRELERVAGDLFARSFAVGQHHNLRQTAHLGVLFNFLNRQRGP